jgi:hypothetical protein
VLTRGPKSYFALGCCLGQLLEKATPEAAIDYLFSIQTVLKYYRFLENRRVEDAKKAAKKEPKKESKKDSGLGIGLGLAPTTTRASIGSSIITSITQNQEKAASRGASFTKRLLRRSSSATKSISPTSSQASLGSSTFHGSLTPMTPLSPSSPMTPMTPMTPMSSIGFNSPTQVGKGASGSTGYKQQSTNPANEFKKSDVPREIWKDSRALQILNNANLVHESGLSIMPDPYQSCLSVLELMAVIYDDVAFMLENSAYNFVSLSEMEYSLISIEENLFPLLIGQAFQIIDAATLDIPYGCPPREVAMLQRYLEMMVVS